MNKIKKGDNVVVLTGKDKGRSGTVLEMLTKSDRVLVQGINMVKVHTKQSQTSEGGIVAKEAAMLAPITGWNIWIFLTTDRKRDT